MSLDKLLAAYKDGIKIDVTSNNIKIHSTTGEVSELDVNSLLEEMKQKFERAKNDPKQNSSLVEITTILLDIFKDHVAKDRVNELYLSNVGSRWMSMLSEEQKNKKIRDIFIPGTHDSAAYKADWTKFIVSNNSFLAPLLREGTLSQKLFATVMHVVFLTPLKPIVNKWNTSR